MRVIPQHMQRQQMARKTMPAIRKRRNLSREEDEEQQQQHDEPQEEEMDAPAHSASAGQESLAFVAPAPIPSSVKSSPSHTHGKKRHSHEDLQSMKKWSCKKNQVSMLENPSFLSEQAKELCKALSIIGSFEQGNASTTGYGVGSTYGGNFASIPDLAGVLSNLRTWMNSMSPNVNNEHCVGLDFAKLITDVNRSACDEQILADPLKFFLRFYSQRPMMERLLSLAENSDCCVKLFGREPTLSALLDAFVHRSGPRGKRKKTWFEDLPKKVAKLIFPKREGEQMYSMKSSKFDEPQMWSAPCVNKEKPAETASWSARQMSHSELESWIVKHSTPSMERKHEELLKLTNTHEKISDVFEESRKDSHRESLSKEGEHVEALKLWSTEVDFKDTQIEIEVDLSGKSESLLEIDAAAADSTSNTPYVKHIFKAISFNNVHSDGHSEVMVLFKALRSDEREVIVDNGYMRSMYPRLLVNFYEQNLHFLCGKPGP